MSILNQFNRKPLFEYDNEKEREFINLQGLVEKNGLNEQYEVHAIFINTKSRYGNAPVIVIDDYMVNAPQHLLQPVEQMIENEEVVNLVNDRKVIFEIYGYQGRNGFGYSIEWKEK